ncbi:short chain dehydrogenase family protein [Collimonas arenae]|uniref:Short chain dehydrogenase family protein n=1 Tax=Collimonas arenae TaxID=279058 RepID=A0A127QIF6_9BURK|nr:glucose 1-dehydrogenase [Collimonas arenae]AMO99491.1 short chain dehydrogenase family protein [Collimonas arenae]AMP09392.1 short chain dehydrogenase family protein [Collimonas arenae]
MSKLNGKVAIVTGASKGIGAGIAIGLAAQGASVVVNYVNSKEDADRAVAEIVAQGGKAISVQADVSKAADVQRLFAETKRQFDRLDVLVNNAGIFKFAPVEAVTEEGFHHHYNSNVLSVFLTIQEALKYFGTAGGSIINIVTAGVEMNPPWSSLYTSTKSAVATITRVLAKELGARNIRVNAIAPGATDTEGAKAIGFIGSGMDTQMISATPLGRLGKPSDIAPAAVFLASDDAAWVSGDILFVSGGLR